MPEVRAIVSLILLLCAAIQVAPAQWVSINRPTDPGYTRTQCFTTDGSTLFAGTLGAGVFRIADLNGTWVRVSNGLTNNDVRGVHTGSSGLYATTANGIFRSTNLGDNWGPVNNGVTNLNGRAISEGIGAVIAASFGGGFYYTTNNGASWTQANTGLPTLFLAALAVQGNTVFASAPSGVFRTTSLGGTWTTVNNGLASTNVGSFAVNGTNLYAFTFLIDASAYRTTNLGDTWVQANSGLASTPETFAVAVGQNVIAGTAGSGFFVSTNAGATWTASNAGFTLMAVRAITIFGTDVVAGTSDGGIWRRPLSQIVTSVRQEPGAVPGRFSLEQNFPNPFNPTTTIRFALPAQAEVRLSVSDLTGREVAVLVDESLGAGSYTASWDAAGAASGVYFYRLTAGPYSAVRKLLVAK
jgi:hypothetical protein